VFCHFSFYIGSAMTDLVNKVAQSGIVTLDLVNYLPEQEIIGLDISHFLFRGLLLKEKEFRAAIKDLDTTAYSGKRVAVFCSTDAIVAQWAYMLVASALQDAGLECFFGTPAQVEEHLLLSQIRQMNTAPYKDQRIVIKGCGSRPLPDAAYLEITKRLRPVVKSLMFGEPCSTVPIYKKR
jgi:hypothetical protein